MDKLREICEKHYDQILPIMAEKVHKEKLQNVQTQLTYGENWRQNSQTREETQLSESKSCDRQRRSKKKRKPSPVTASRDTYLSQGTSVFSKLIREKEKPARRRSPISATMFTKLGNRDKTVFTWLGERKKDVHSRLGPEVASRRRHANERRSASTGRSVEDPNHRKKEARNLIRSYVTCSSERQIEIEREWDAAVRANPRQSARAEETCLSENEHDRGGH
ncbi:hypothetical protein Tco_0761874 [Tanacetum coccineum]